MGMKSNPWCLSPWGSEGWGAAGRGAAGSQSLLWALPDAKCHGEGDGDTGGAQHAAQHTG